MVTTHAGSMILWWLFNFGLLIGIECGASGKCSHGKIHVGYNVQKGDLHFVHCLDFKNLKPKEIERSCVDRCCKNDECSFAVMPLTKDYDVNCCLASCKICKLERNNQFSAIRVQHINTSSEASTAESSTSEAKTESDAKTDSSLTTDTPSEHSSTEDGGHTSSSTEKESSTENLEKAGTSTSETTTKEAVRPTTTAATSTTTEKKTTTTSTTTTSTTTTKKPTTVTTTAKPTPPSKRPAAAKPHERIHTIVPVKVPSHSTFGMTRKNLPQRDVTTTASLVAALCLGVLFLTAVAVVGSKRLYESWKRRHYTQVDYLINGMYN